jgi:hypothetical protein
VALEDWIRRHWTEWYEGPVAELEHRDAIREQAFGSAYATQKLEWTARYEVHLDRKLERTLAMLIRLKELRRSIVPRGQGHLASVMALRNWRGPGPH